MYHRPHTPILDITPWQSRRPDLSILYIWGFPGILPVSTIICPYAKKKTKNILASFRSNKYHDFLYAVCPQVAVSRFYTTGKTYLATRSVLDSSRVVSLIAIRFVSFYTTGKTCFWLLNVLWMV